MKWSFSNDMPIYTQLVEQMKIGIVTGVFPPGGRLPSVRDLAMEAGVNPNTMQRAMAQLESEGLMYSQRTAGRFVTEDTDQIAEVRNDLARMHVRAFICAMNDLAIPVDRVLSLLRAEYGKELENDEHPEL